MLREQLTGAGNRLAIRVQLTLRRAEVSVAGDLPEYMHGHARVIHFRCKLSNTTRYTDNGSVANLASSQRRVWKCPDFGCESLAPPDMRYRRAGWRSRYSMTARRINSDAESDSPTSTRCSISARSARGNRMGSTGVLPVGGVPLVGRPMRSVAPTSSGLRTVYSPDSTAGVGGIHGDLQRPRGESTFRACP